MKQYKVLKVSREDWRISDGTHFWNMGQDERSGQEALLNHFAKDGWRLVQAVGNENVGGYGSEIYLYLESEYDT